MQKRLIIFLAAAFLAASSRVEAGLIVVSGDVTPVFFLTNTFPDSAVAGNQRFFSNVLGSGTTVRVSNESFNSFAPPEINEYYNTLPGVSSSILGGPLTSASLAGVDLLHLPFLSNAFTASELTAIGGFLDAGGSLFATGEALGITNGATSNAHVNALLSAVGSSLSLTNASLDIGTNTAAGAQIAAHPLTTGVTAYNYGFTSIVNGGTPLFRTINGSTFVAVEQRLVATVPEPGSIVIFSLLIGLAGIAAARRRPQ